MSGSDPALPAGAYGAALAGLPAMGPVRLRAVLDAWEPAELSDQALHCLGDERHLGHACQRLKAPQISPGGKPSPAVSWLICAAAFCRDCSSASLLAASTRSESNSAPSSSASGSIFTDRTF